MVIQCVAAIILVSNDCQRTAWTCLASLGPPTRPAVQGIADTQERLREAMAKADAEEAGYKKQLEEAAVELSQKDAALAAAHAELAIREGSAEAAHNSLMEERRAHEAACELAARLRQGLDSAKQRGDALKAARSRAEEELAACRWALPALLCKSC